MRARVKVVIYGEAGNILSQRVKEQTAAYDQVRAPIMTNYYMIETQADVARLLAP